MLMRMCNVANVQACVICIIEFLVHPGALSFTAPIMEQVFLEMKGCRDGKSAKTSATRNYLYNAVVIICIPVPTSFLT